MNRMPHVKRRLSVIFMMLGVVALAFVGGTLQASTSDGNVAWQATEATGSWDHVPTQPLPSSITASLRLAETGKPMRITISQASRRHLLRLDIARDKQGRVLKVQSFVHRGEWKKAGGQLPLTFWPSDKTVLTQLSEDGVTPRSWHDRLLSLRVVLQADGAMVWLENKLVAQVARPLRGRVKLSFEASEGDAVASVEARPLTEAWRYLPIELSPIADEPTLNPIAQTESSFDGVPFEFAADGRRWVDLKSAQWADWSRDPAGYYERYDQGPVFLDDPRMPMIQLPRGDYIAAHVLAVADDNEALSNQLTLRAGRYNHGIRGQVIRHDFGTDVPRESAGGQPVLSTSAGPLYHVRIPMTAAFSQDVEGDVVDVELTKELRVARRSPDPNRFRWRALGLASGVRIAAITFERSPLQMTVSSGESGHLFVQPQVPAFNVTLNNISGVRRDYRVVLTATHFDGHVVVAESAGGVDPGDTDDVSVELPDVRRGYHDVAVALYDGEGRFVLERQTSFAVLPDKERPHHARSPVGTWDHGTRHFSPGYDETATLYQKLGLRYGMFWASASDHAKYGVRKGNDFKQNMRDDVNTIIARYRTEREKWPSMLPRMMIFHEDSISGPHVTRAPDLFHDRPPYKLSEQEQVRFKEMWDVAVQAAESMRKHDPDVQITLGNGPLPLREEFYRQGFPAELFDAAGNESGVFGRLPESQPPDIVASNASLWMDRQLLDHYGYGDKKIVQAHEITYPSTNPSNLDHETQAAYFVRNILHSMAWEIPQIRVGTIADVGNSYYFSNWGASGFFNRKPELNPKPAAVAIGTLTWVLDGATFDRSLSTGSASLYGLAFDRADDRRVVALWTVRGQRPVTLSLDHATEAMLIDSQGSESALAMEGGRVTITLTPMPVYLVADGDVTAVEAGEPRYQARPDGEAAVIAALDSLDGWSIGEDRNPELEFYNPFEPRRKGDFSFETVASFEGRSGVLKVTPQPIDYGKATMPMYAELIHEGGLDLPGEPTELGVWVNGNSGWGRIIYELEDANGERWVSIGAQAASNNRWMADWLPAEMLDEYDPGKVADWNTNDVFGLSRINFDGWRYLAIPLPGQYPGEGYHWPANSQWRSDQDGTVDYPLTLKKIIVQLPEKMLHIKTFEPVDRPEIYLSDVTAVQGDADRWVKQTPGSYSDGIQNGLFGMKPAVATEQNVGRESRTTPGPRTIASSTLQEVSHD